MASFSSRIDRYKKMKRSLNNENRNIRLAEIIYMDIQFVNTELININIQLNIINSPLKGKQAYSLINPP